MIIGVNVVTQVLNLIQTEKVRLDPERLEGLYQQLGERTAEDIVCRAIEELAVRLAQCERLWRDDNITALAKNAHSIIAIADQVGMTALAKVARDVSDTAKKGDPVAVGATLFRLIRIGERSLTAVWDTQDLSV
jgi:HPt (histidine-containing phosphotransfer) domain-containing protein